MRKFGRSYLLSVAIAFTAVMIAFISHDAMAQTTNSNLVNATFAMAARYATSGGLVATADLNLDGKPDLVVAGPLRVLLGNGDGTFQLPAVAYDSGPIRGLAVGDVNRDGKPDVVVTSEDQFGGQFRVFLGNGDGTLQPASVFDIPRGGTVALGDLNGDGNPDLVMAMSEAVGVLLGNGDGTFQNPVSYDSGGTYTSGVIVSDVNGDGKPDIIASNLTGTIGVLLGIGDGTFKPTVIYNTGAPDFAFTMSPVVGDLNGDGKPDVAVVNQFFSEGVDVLLGNGDGTFQKAVTYGITSGRPSNVTISDVNGDGKPDLVVGLSSTLRSVGVLLGNGDGTFQPPTNYESGAGDISDVASLAIGDFNQDGKIDIAQACIVQQFVSAGLCIMMNNTGAPPASTVLTSNINPAPAGSIITYTATVKAQPGGDVTGFVRLQDANTKWGGGWVNALNHWVPLVNNQATFTAMYTKGGVRSLTATYSGDLQNQSSKSLSFLEYISSIGTQTVVTTSASPVFVGQPVTFTATIASIFHLPVPDGELVTFHEGTFVLGSATTKDGKATFTASFLSAKTHVINATYAGDTKLKPSTGGVAEVIVKYPTTTILDLIPNPSNFLQLVTFTATVSPSGPYPATGYVRLSDGTAWHVAVPLKNGTAIFTKSNFAVGTHAITAQYLGDSFNGKSTSSIVNQVVH